MRSIRKTNKLTTLDVIAWVAQDRKELYENLLHFKGYYGDENEEGYIAVDGAEQSVYIYEKTNEYGDVTDVRFEYYVWRNEEFVKTSNWGIDEDFVKKMVIEITKNHYNNLEQKAELEHYYA